MITRVKQGNKFMTYSCPEAEMIAEEDNFEDTSVASSRESRVWNEKKVLKKRLQQKQKFVPNNIN